MEIERKFLVKDRSFIELAKSSSYIRQAYLSVSKQNTVRVRTRDEKGYITIKSRSANGGLSREEWEYEIPYNEALEMMKLSIANIIEKRRYLVDYDGYTWEVDVFESPITNIIVAEIELPTLDAKFKKPDWIDREVTGQKEFYNSFLAQIEKV